MFLYIERGQLNKKSPHDTTESFYDSLGRKLLTSMCKVMCINVGIEELS